MMTTMPANTSASAPARSLQRKTTGRVTLPCQFAWNRAPLVDELWVRDRHPAPGNLQRHLADYRAAPHRTVRARLAHTAPTSDAGGAILCNRLCCFADRGRSPHDDVLKKAERRTVGNVRSSR